MRLKLNFKWYLFIKIMIWLLFLVYAIVTIEKVTTRSTVLYEMLICVPLLQLTVIEFINSWYKNGTPKIMDWYRLTIFLSIIYNYLSLADKLDQKITSFFGGITLDPSQIIVTLFVILVGLLALKLSEFIFWIIKIRKYKEPTIVTEVDYLIKRKFIFYTVGLFTFFIQLYFVISGVTGYGNESNANVSGISFLIIILGQLTVFYLIVLGFMNFKYLPNNKYVTFYYYLFLALAIITGLLSGMKEVTIIPIVCFLITYLFSKTLIPIKFSVIVLLLLLVLYPLNNSYRMILNRFPKLDKKEAFYIAAAETFSGNLSSIFKEGKENFSDRLSMFPVLQYSIEHEESWIYFKHMNRYIYLPVSLLPRAIIKDKPMSDAGAVYSFMISGEKNKNSQTATTFGWAYMEGGIQYVFIIYLLLGICINFFQSYFNKDSLLSIIFYSSLVITFLKVETDPYFIISGFSQTIIIFVSFYYFFLKKISYRNTDSSKENS